MAFDFSKLKSPNQAEMQAAEQRRREREIKDDHDKRLSFCKHEIRIVLAYDAEIRFTTTLSRIASFRGTDPSGRTVRAIFYTPDHLSRDETDSIVSPMHEGVTLILKGYWKRENSDHFTFKAQFVEIAPSSVKGPARVECGSVTKDLSAFD